MAWPITHVRIHYPLASMLSLTETDWDSLTEWDFRQSGIFAGGAFFDLSYVDMYVRPMFSPSIWSGYLTLAPPVS